MSSIISSIVTCHRSDHTLVLHAVDRALIAERMVSLASTWNVARPADSPPKSSSLQLVQECIKLCPVGLSQSKLAMFAGDYMLLTSVVMLHHKTIQQLTSSKSSYLSRQFSQYPGLGSLLIAFLLPSDGAAGSATRLSALASFSSWIPPSFSCALLLAAR